MKNDNKQLRNEGTIQRLVVESYAAAAHTNNPHFVLVGHPFDPTRETVKQAWIFFCKNEENPSPPYFNQQNKGIYMILRENQMLLVLEILRRKQVLWCAFYDQGPDSGITPIAILVEKDSIPQDDTRLIELLENDLKGEGIQSCAHAAH